MSKGPGFGAMLCRGGLALTIGLGCATACYAASTAAIVMQRQTAMKQVAAAMKEASGLAGGQTPWSAARAQAAMASISANARKLRALYPPGSDNDPKSEALPAVWSNRADFEKRLAETDGLAAVAGKAKSAAEFKAGVTALGATCKTCHAKYRL